MRGQDMEEQFISIQLGGARHCLVVHITQRGSQTHRN